jgi:hypothetical protein
MTPAWIPDVLAGLMLAVAAVSAGRLAAAGPWRRGAVVTDTDVAHLFMAIAMAGMLAPAVTTLPGGVWEAIFGLLTVWFARRVVLDARASGARALAGGHCVPHLAHSAAMLYMFLALAAPAPGRGPGMDGMGRPGSQALAYPALTFAFALILSGYAVWDLDQVSGRRYSLPRARVSVAAAAPAMAATGSRAASGASGGDEPAGQPDPGAQAAGPGARDLLLSPAMTVCCRIVMGVTMAFMLLVMI